MEEPCKDSGEWLVIEILESERNILYSSFDRKDALRYARKIVRKNDNIDTVFYFGAVIRNGDVYTWYRTAHGLRHKKHWIRVQKKK
jgi:hypothetical protein